MASRINDDYLRKGKKLGKRPIELEIKKYGPGNFKLEVYMLSQELLNKIYPEFHTLSSAGYLEGICPKSLIKGGGKEADKFNVSVFKKKVRNLVLVLEQIFILLLNPEYNRLKVAGSAAGNKIDKELMLPGSPFFYFFLWRVHTYSKKIKKVFLKKHERLLTCMMQKKKIINI